MPMVMNHNWMTSLKKLGVDAACLAKLSADSWEIKQQGDNLVFEHATKPNITAPVSGPQVLAAVKGLLTPDAVASMRVTINNTLKQFLLGQKVEQPSPKPLPQAVVPDQMAVAAGNPQAVNVAMLLQTHGLSLDMLAKHTPRSESQMSAPAVPLLVADGLYAPVRGTSAGSKYFMIGVFKTFRVGARYSIGGKLSIRVEGAVPHAAVKALEALSFTNGGKYWSTHLIAGSVQEAQRFASCMLGSMGEPLLTPLPEMQKIANKGAG